MQEVPASAAFYDICVGRQADEFTVDNLLARTIPGVDPVAAITAQDMIGSIETVDALDIRLGRID